MKFLLDTNICIYIIKRRPPKVLEKFLHYKPSDIGVSTITVAELAHGVENSQHKQQNQLALESFLAPLEICSFDLSAAFVYGRVRTRLQANGAPIGAMDMQIAAHAIALDTTLVTNNTREFERVAGLKLENWAI